MSTTAKMPSKSAMLKLAIPLIIAMIILVIYNFKSNSAYQQLADEIGEGMFADPALSAVLLTYRDNNNILELTVNVSGVTGELAAYRAEVVKFVCNASVLSKRLSSAQRIDIKIIASPRKKDKYLDISVGEAQCGALD